MTKIYLVFVMVCWTVYGTPMRSSVGARHVISSMAEQDVPFDAEVEYIESTGQQWIITPIAYESGVVRIEGRVISTDNLTVTNPRRIFLGCGDVNSSDGIFLGFYWQQQYWDKIGAWANTQGSSASTSYGEGFVLEYDSETCMVYRWRRNGNTATFFESTTDTSQWNKNIKVFNNIPITLFAANSQGDNASGYRMYWIRIYLEGELVLQCIPVRKDGIGYMYDTVSGTLLENRGTIPFVIGLDV